MKDTGFSAASWAGGSDQHYEGQMFSALRRNTHFPHVLTCIAPRPELPIALEPTFQHIFFGWVLCSEIHTIDPQGEEISHMKGFSMFVLILWLYFTNLSQDIIESIHSNINVLKLIKETGQFVMHRLIQWQQPQGGEETTMCSSVTCKLQIGPWLQGKVPYIFYCHVMSAERSYLSEAVLCPFVLVLNEVHGC